MKRYTLAVIVILAACNRTPPDPYTTKFAALAQEHFRLIGGEPGKSYEAELTKAHNVFWRSVYSQCVSDAKKENASSFEAIAVVDDDGVVRDLLTMPKSKNLECFQRAMTGRQYPKPPVAPFYELFRVALPRS